jgi:hypothetical protein
VLLRWIDELQHQSTFKCFFVIYFTRYESVRVRVSKIG